MAKSWNVKQMMTGQNSTHLQRRRLESCSRYRRCDRGPANDLQGDGTDQHGWRCTYTCAAVVFACHNYASIGVRDALKGQV